MDSDRLRLKTPDASGAALAGVAVLGGVCFGLEAGASRSWAAEPIAVGPIIRAVPLHGVPVNLIATVQVRLETRPEFIDVEGAWVVQLDDLERQAAAVARAGGLATGSCQDGKPIEVKVQGAELIPAEPALTLRLRGKVRAWLCKPIKTHLSPELDVMAQTTLSARIDDRQVVTLTADDTTIHVPEIARLGPAAQAASAQLAGLAAKMQTDLRAELSKHAVAAKDVLAPLDVQGLDVRFTGKTVGGSVRGQVPVAAAAKLLQTLIDKAGVR